MLSGPGMVTDCFSWPIGSIKIPSFFRKSLCHNVMKLEDPASGCHFGFDDEVELNGTPFSRHLLWLTDFQVEFNTQASSQWDSFGTSKKPIHQNERRLPIQLISRIFQPALSTTEQSQQLMPFKHLKSPKACQH